jgi:hypothetical protein
MLEAILGFSKELKIRNKELFYFGALCLALSIVCIVLSKLTTTQIQGVNAWFKPFKFAVSIGLFAWTMAWYCHYLLHFNTSIFNWTVIILFGLELVYIIFQASNGQLSHFNISTVTYSILYSLMGLAATIITLLYSLYWFTIFRTVFPQFAYILSLGNSLRNINFCCFFI